MLSKIKPILALLVLALLAPAAGASQSAFAPSGFYLVTTASGTALYQRDAWDGNHDFVQVVQLQSGAAVQLLHGPIVDPGQGLGVYDGDNPLFARQYLSVVWDKVSTQQDNAFCLTNGQFFSTYTGPAALSFPLKVDGAIISDGYAIDQYPNHQLMLEIWPHKADIRPLTAANLQTSAAPEILAGLTEAASGRRANTRAGRTFVGVGEPGTDGSYQTIYIFTSRLARKTEAAAALRAFGAEKVIMFDGGGSAQLICHGHTYAGPGRPVPQTIAVLAAPPPATNDFFSQVDLFGVCEPYLLLFTLTDHLIWPMNPLC